MLPPPPMSVHVLDVGFFADVSVYWTPKFAVAPPDGSGLRENDAIGEPIPFSQMMSPKSIRPFPLKSKHSIGWLAAAQSRLSDRISTSVRFTTPSPLMSSYLPSPSGSRGRFVHPGKMR